MSSKTQYKEYSVNLKKQVTELNKKLKETEDTLINCGTMNQRLIMANESLKRQLEVKSLNWKVLFINKRKTLKFLYELYSRLSTSQGTSYQDFFYVMWNDGKCTKEKFEKILKL